MGTKKINIKILWNNPPNGCAVLKKTYPDGREYSRTISPDSLLTTFEAGELLGCSHNYIHRMIERKIINFYNQNGKKYVKMKDLLLYKETKKGKGRPKREDAFLIN